MTITGASPAGVYDNSGTVLLGLQSPNGTVFPTSTDVFDVRLYGAKCDGYALYDVSATASINSVVTSVTGKFTQSDVGKSCVLIQYVDVGVASKHGTIASVSAAGSATLSLTAAPSSALTKAILIYGTDDTNAINATLTAATNNTPFGGVVFIPLGITCFTQPFVVPSNVDLQGVVNSSTGGHAKDFRHRGSNLAMLGYTTLSLITMGNSGNDPKGNIIRNINIEASYNCWRVLDANARTVEYYNVTVVRPGGGECLYASPTAHVFNCNFLGSNLNNTVVLGGDGKFIGNIVTGSGNGFYEIKLSNTDDILIAHNHVWKDTNVPTALGGHIWVSYNSANVLSGSVTILGNKLDTSYGPHIYVSGAGNSVGRSLNIVANNAFQSDTGGTTQYPFLALNLASGSVLRGLNVQSNTGRASWNSITNGQINYLIDNSASTGGVVLGSSVCGNVMDDCNGAYNAFTPSYSAGNVMIAPGAGSTGAATVF